MIAGYMQGFPVYKSQRKSRIGIKVNNLPFFLFQHRQPMTGTNQQIAGRCFAQHPDIFSRQYILRCMQVKQTVFLIQQEKPVSMCSYPNIPLPVFIDDIDKFFLGSDFLFQVYLICLKPFFINYIGNTTLIRSKPQSVVRIKQQGIIIMCKQFFLMDQYFRLQCLFIQADNRRGSADI